MIERVILIDGLSEKTCLEFYKRMKIMRRFDEKVIELVNTNEVYGTTNEYIGEETVGFACVSKHPEPEDALKDMYTTEYKGIPDKGWV